MPCHGVCEQDEEEGPLGPPGGLPGSATTGQGVTNTQPVFMYVSLVLEPDLGGGQRREDLPMETGQLE